MKSVSQLSFRPILKHLKMLAANFESVSDVNVSIQNVSGT